MCGHDETVMKARQLSLLLLLFVLLLLFGLAEFGLRGVASAKREQLAGQFDEGGMRAIPSATPGLIYTYDPDFPEVNSRGYIDDEHSLAKPDGVYRIVLIGDSVADGRDVDPSVRFASVIEDSLQIPGKSVEVIVLARVGYSTVQERVLLEEEAFTYDPDVILWSYCLNDPADPVMHNANGNLGVFHHRPRSYLVDFVRRSAFSVRERLKGRNCPGEFHARLHCIYWDDVVRHVEAIGEAGKQEGVPVVFLIHPIFEEGRSLGENSLADLHARLAEVAGRAGMEPLDLLPGLSEFDPDEIKIHNERYYDPWHLNEKGHAVTAGVIMEYMAARP